jgi:hypothetical protein
VRQSFSAAGSRSLQRDGPSTAAPPARIARLDELLDRFNVPEGEVIALLGTLTPTEKTLVVSGGYRDKLADALNTDEMVRAVNNLGASASLQIKLDWVRAAAGGASSIDYPQIAAMVRRAPQPERDALKTRPWREFFVDVCTNATMPDAVIDLKHDLQTKLDWLIEEGTNGDRVARVIRLSPATDLAPTLANRPLMDRLRDELSGAGYAVAEKMLRHGLLGEREFENTTDTGNHYRSWVSLYRSGLNISKRVKFVEQGTFAAGGFAALKARIIAAITTYLTGKFKLKIQSVGAPQEGDGVYPIVVRVIDDSSAPYPLRLRGGAHGRSAVDEDGGDIYALGQGTETSVPDIVLAHESAHMILGASDEYANASVRVTGRVVYTDHSLLGNFYNEGIAAAEIKARHFQFLVRQVSTWFPGRTISIIK